MVQNPNRLLDKTHLSIDQAEERGFLHRDYIAHCFRWSHVVKQLITRHGYKDSHIIDVGCGRDQPLPRLLYANKMTGFSYTGIDINNLDFHPTLVKAHQNGKINVALMDNTDASLLNEDDLPWGLADYLVSFEVLEHMQPFIAHRMLHAWKRLVKPKGKLFVSTPVYNGSAADNHINEMGRITLGKAFEAAGLTVINHHGTFASRSELIPAMGVAQRMLYEALSEYYDSNVLSTIFAPLYPNASRNVLWVLENTPPTTLKFIEDRDTCQNPNIEELFTGRIE